MTSPAADEHPVARLLAQADRRRRSLRRMVLARRRPLAALLAGAAVFLGVRATAAPPPATTPVVVADHDLAAGARVAADDMRTAAWPSELAPRGALRADELVGHVVAAAVPAGEPVTRERVVGAGLVPDEGAIAMPVRLPDPAVAALLRPGDRISLAAVDPESDVTEPVTTGAVVLAVPDAIGDDGGLAGSVVVLAVDESDTDDVANAAVRRFLTLTYER